MALQKRYQIALETKLDQLWHQGFCIFERWELFAWFGSKDKMTKVVWREILKTWEQTYNLKVDERPLSVIKCDTTSTPQTFVVTQSKRAKSMKVMAL